MKKLKFPIIKGPLPGAKWLSMDDYLKFINLHLKYAISDIKVSRKWKKLSAVNVPFLFK